MDKTAQVIAKLLGSAPVILGFLVWLIYHNVTAWDYTNFISDVAIEIGLLILRAEKVEGDQMQNYIKETRKASKKDLAVTKKIEKRL